MPLPGAIVREKKSSGCDVPTRCTDKVMLNAPYTMENGGGITMLQIVTERHKNIKLIRVCQLFFKKGCSPADANGIIIKNNMSPTHPHPPKERGYKKSYFYERPESIPTPVTWIVQGKWSCFYLGARTYSKCSKISNTSCLLKGHRQTVKTQIRKSSLISVFSVCYFYSHFVNISPVHQHFI